MTKMDTVQLLLSSASSDNAIYANDKYVKINDSQLRFENYEYNSDTGFNEAGEKARPIDGSSGTVKKKAFLGKPAPLQCMEELSDPEWRPLLDGAIPAYPPLGKH